MAFNERIQGRPHTNLAYPDRPFTNLKSFDREFRAVFQELVPGQTRHSFLYHFYKYLHAYVHIDKKPTFAEEILRFGKYIQYKYELNN